MIAKNFLHTAPRRQRGVEHVKQRGRRPLLGRAQLAQQVHSGAVREDRARERTHLGDRIRDVDDGSHYEDRAHGEARTHGERDEKGDGHEHTTGQRMRAVPREARQRSQCGW
jgi:hypothetical protein